MEAWTTEEFGEKRLIFKVEDLERLEVVKKLGQFHFNILHEEGSNWCWVTEVDIPNAIYCITSLYTLTIM